MTDTNKPPKPRRGRAKGVVPLDRDGNPVNPTPLGSRRSRRYAPREDNGRPRDSRGPSPQAIHPEEIDVIALAGGSKSLDEMTLIERRAVSLYLRTGKLPTRARRAFDPEYVRFDARLKEILELARAVDGPQILNTVRNMRTALFETTELLKVFQERERRETEERTVRAAFENSLSVKEAAEAMGKKHSWIDSRFRKLRREAEEKERAAAAAVEASEADRDVAAPVLTPELLEQLYAIATERERRVAEGLAVPFEGEDRSRG